MAVTLVFCLQLDSGEVDILQGEEVCLQGYGPGGLQGGHGPDY